jgi:hypothetical protein
VAESPVPPVPPTDPPQDQQGGRAGGQSGRSGGGAPAGRSPKKGAARRPNRGVAAPESDGLPPAPGSAGPHPGQREVKSVILDRLNARTAPRAAAMPGRAFVYSSNDGHVVHLTAAPKGGLAAWGKPKYEWRIEVDTTLRTDRLVDTIPSQTEPGRFVVTMDVEWSVTDPVRVVKRGIEDGAGLVQSRLFAGARGIGYGHRIDQAAELERALNQRLGLGPQEYAEGITVHRCDVRVELDEWSWRKRVMIDRNQFRRQLNDEEVTALRESVRTRSDLFLHYLAQDPARVGDLILDMRDHEQIKDERVIDLFKQAVDAKIMQPAEVNEMLRRLLGSITDVYRPDGRTDMFGHHAPPSELLPPGGPGSPLGDTAGAPPDGATVIAGMAADDDEEPDTMPESLQPRSENGVTGWTGMPWDS